MSSEEVSTKDFPLPELNLTKFSDRLRCDRKQPCSTCTARGLALSCAYVNNQAPQSPAVAIPQRRRAPRPHETHSGHPQATVQDRLGQLEQIVVSLMQKTTSGDQDRPDQHPVVSVSQGHPQKSSSEGAINSEDSPALSDGGNAWFSSSDAQYVGGTHWAVILDGIAELKEQLEREDDRNIEKPAMLHTFLLYGCKSASKEDILASLPDRSVVDRYISQYFNRLDLAPCKFLTCTKSISTNTGYHSLQLVCTVVSFHARYANGFTKQIMWF